MNSASSRFKQSDVEKFMNQFTIYVVTALVILTLVLAIIGGYWYAEAQEIKDELN